MQFQINQLDSFGQINQENINQSLQTLAKVAPLVLSNHKPELVSQADLHLIHINFISDDEIQELNNDHRDKNKPTDVLSWGFINQDLLPHEMAGEIYVSIETCQRQAQDKGHSLEQETIFLIVHGLLHVFEYDHQTDSEEQEMDSVHAEIMSKL